MSARNVLQYRRRLVTLVLVAVVGCVLALARAGIVSRAATVADHSVLDSVGLRTITLNALANQSNVRPLTAASLGVVARVPHVAAVDPWLQSGFGIKTHAFPGLVLFATTPQPDALPPIERAIRPHVFPLGAHELVLPARFHGLDLSPLLGKTVSIDYTQAVAAGVGGTSATTRVHVVGLYNPSFQTSAGPNAAYAPLSLVTQLAAAQAGVSPHQFLVSNDYQQATVVVDSSTHVTAVLNQVHHLGFSASSLRQQLQTLPAGLQLLQRGSQLALGVLVAFSLLAGSGLASTFIRQRTREIGLLKAIGFRRRRILGILLSELAIIGVVAALIGVIAGNIVSAVLGLLLDGTSVFGIAFPAGAVVLPTLGWTALVAVAVAFAIVVGGALPAARAAGLEPDLALRQW